METQRKISLGLDSSTQSLTGVLLDVETGEIVRELSISYRSDPRCLGWGIDHQEMIIPPREPGEADQPPKMFLASLDAFFSDLKASGFPLNTISVINTSGQQHGHVYLGGEAREAFARLTKKGCEGNLVSNLGDVFSYGTAPIWKTSNTANDAADIRKGVGGKQKMIELSGSDSPLRFTGAVVRRVGRQFPALYKKTDRILLISNFIPAVLSGNVDMPIDFGNGAGMSLMNYSKKIWDGKLFAAAADGLPGGTRAMKAKFTEVAHPLTVGGTVARYFVDAYGFDPKCRVVIGSGDNPQTKVIVDGDLLSLGTSFVIMASGKEAFVDPEGNANAMYDGLGRPFIFGCRTNGALVWDRVRESHGLSKTDFTRAERALAVTPPGSVMRIWQPDTESFPLSKPFDFQNLDGGEKTFETDYAGVVDCALALVWNTSRKIVPGGPERLYVSGGPTSNREIVKRIAAIWNCPVVVIGKAGAALGAAVAGIAAVTPEKKREKVVAAVCARVTGAGSEVKPIPEMVDAYHGKGGYIERLKKAMKKYLL